LNGIMYYFVLNSHYSFALSINSFAEIEPLIRARKELLTLLQHWYATQISRPGIPEFL